MSDTTSPKSTDKQHDKSTPMTSVPFHLMNQAAS